MVMPMSTAKPVAVAAIIRVGRVPWIMPANTSRPR